VSVVDVRVGDEVQRLPSPSSCLCLVCVICWTLDVETKMEWRGVKEKEPTAAEVSRRAGIDTAGLRNTSVRRWGEGAVECRQQKAGTTACASRLAACAASPASVSRLYPPTYSPKRVCGRLSLPIVPPPSPSLSPPRNPESSTTPRAAACMSEVIPEISPRPLPLVLLALRVLALEPSRLNRTEQRREETTNDRRGRSEIGKKGEGRDERGWIQHCGQAGRGEKDGEDGEAVANGVMENGRGHRLRSPFHAHLPVPWLQCCLSEQGVRV
jgi:hypothetical protein